MFKYYIHKSGISVSVRSAEGFSLPKLKQLQVYHTQGEKKPNPLILLVIFRSSI